MKDIDNIIVAPHAGIDVEHGVSKEKLLDIIHHGQINVASSFCILLGIRKLTELGYW